MMNSENRFVACRRFFTVAALLLFVSNITALAQSEITDPVVFLAVEGRIAEIRSGLASGLWEGTASEDLARALLEEDGAIAEREMRKVALRADVRIDVGILAWLHIYGYQRLVGNEDGEIEALTELHRHRDLAETMMGEPLPELSPQKRYSIQIGAFSSRRNARSLAERTRSEGHQAEVVEIESGGRTLYAVWVGRFSSPRVAREFGNRTYGREDSDYRVVKRSR